MTIDEEIAALMASTKAAGKPVPLALLKDAVKACKPKRKARPERLKLTPEERFRSRIRGRANALKSKIAKAAADIAAHEADRRDFQLAMVAANAYATISGYRMQLKWHTDTYPWLTPDYDRVNRMTNLTEQQMDAFINQVIERVTASGTGPSKDRLASLAPTFRDVFTRHFNAMVADLQQALSGEAS